MNPADKKREFLNKTKLEFYKQVKAYQQTLKPTKEIEGYGSIPIVGERNYPYLKIHNVSTKDKKNSFFNSGKVVLQDYNEIFKLKAKNILGSTDQSHIRRKDERINKEVVDIYKSKNEIEFRSEFTKELKFDKVVLNKAAGIVGSKNPLERIEANENASTSKQIEKYTQEDVKAKEAIIKMYKREVNEHQIIHLLGLGTLGIEVNKKLVPTRWAISAYDQTIEKYLANQITNYRVLDKFEVYHKYNKGNEFVIVLLPDTFHGSITESWGHGNENDYFDNKNKLDKKEPETAGGYYATKIAIFENLQIRKRQASIISIRIIDEYDVPLGVVMVRELAREAMKNRIFSSSDFSEVLKFVEGKYTKHYKHLINGKVLKERKLQRKLGEFI